MIEKNGNYYSGYYELAIEQGKKIDGLMRDMSFDRSLILSSNDGIDSCPYEGADGTIFLKGSCNLFANMLKKKYGYDVFSANCGKDCHWFCKTTYDGKTLYVDVPKRREYARFSYSLRKCMKLMEILVGYEGDWILAWKEYGYVYPRGRQKSKNKSGRKQKETC